MGLSSVDIGHLAEVRDAHTSFAVASDLDLGPVPP